MQTSPPIMATGEDLPAEILLLIAEVLTEKKDFDSLLNWALLSRRLATITIPIIYGSYEHSPAFSAEILPMEKTIRLWRSIILSCLNLTAFPYALYIRTLKLGALHKELLNDIAGNADLRNKLFEGPMSRFLFESQTTRYQSQRTKLPPLEFQTIIDSVGDVISKFLKKSMSITGKQAALENLEGNHIRANLLPIWTSCMPRLMSLQIDEGSAILPELGTAIASSCPFFKELRCYMCLGNEVDQDMASFILALPQNQLQQFGVMSQNVLGKHSFRALGERHGGSLRDFSIQVGSSGIYDIPMLDQCTALKSISLDFSMLGVQEKDMREVGEWLEKCHELSHLDIRNAQFVGHVLTPVLESPKIRLKELVVDRSHLGGDQFFKYLGNQTELEVLEITTPRDDFNWTREDPGYDDLVGSLQTLQKLHTVVLKCMQLGEAQLHTVVSSLSNLEHFGWSTDMAYDESLVILQMVPKLKSITCFGTSQFSFESMRDFVQALASRGTQHQGFRLNVLNQYGIRELKLSQEEEEFLKREVEEKLGGSILWTYVMDEDEMHEDDFSD